eukprot:2801878-Amphidinium_carterae.1
MVRAATTDELRGLEELTELLPELVEETAERRGKRQYKDLTAEMPSEMESEARSRMRRNSTDSQSTRAPMAATSSHGDGDTAASAATTTAATTSRQRRLSSVGPTRQVRPRMEPGVQERVDAIERNLSSPSGEATGVETTPPARERSRTPPRTEEAEAMPTTSQVSQVSVTPEGFVQKKTDEVKWRNLAKHEEAGFRAAMRVEAQAMLKDRNAMTPLTWEETQQVRQEKSDRIILSRWHLRRKPKETEHGVEFVPKARWILVGFKDPDLDVLMADSYSPTPS